MPRTRKTARKAPAPKAPVSKSIQAPHDVEQPDKALAGEPLQPVAPAPVVGAPMSEGGRPSEVPIFPVPSAGEKTVSTKPVDLKDFKGSYKLKGSNEKYGLKVIPNDPHGRTHHLKSVDHYWAGSEDEFKQAFEK